MPLWYNKFTKLTKLTEIFVLGNTVMSFLLLSWYAVHSNTKCVSSSMLPVLQALHVLCSGGSLGLQWRPVSIRHLWLSNLIFAISLFNFHCRLHINKPPYWAHYYSLVWHMFSIYSRLVHYARICVHMRRIVVPVFYCFYCLSVHTRSNTSCWLNLQCFTVHLSL